MQFDCYKRNQTKDQQNFIITNHFSINHYQLRINQCASMTQTNNNQQSQSNHLTFLILPSERLITYDSLSHQVDLSLNIKAQDCIVNKNKTKIAVIVSKSVKSYDIRNPLHSQSQTTFESYFPKKVEGLTMDSNDKVVVSDKFGDIYLATPQNPVYLNSNLGIPTFIKHVLDDKTKREYIMLGDDYCKLKIYNYLNMHEVTAIWYISNSIPLDVIQVDSRRFVLLVKHEDKENLKHTYRLYQFDIHNLNQGDFNGKLIYSDKSQALNSSQYHPCSMTYSEATKTLNFLKLYDGSIQITSFTSEDSNGEFLLLKNCRQKLPELIKQANWIEGQMISNQNKEEEYILVSYGKYYNIQGSSVQQGQKDKTQVKKAWYSVEESAQSAQFYKVSSKQFLMKKKI